MTDPTKIDRILAHATRAPSSHNTQPWLFRVGPDRIDLLADRTRALPVNDPEDRELTISCACALMSLRVAAAAEGLGSGVTLLPDSDDHDLLARVDLRGAPDAELAALASVIDLRQTHRVRFEDRPVDSDHIATLSRVAQAENARFAPLHSAEKRHAAADLVATGDAALWDDARWRRELAQWMHPRRKGDGLTLPWLAIPLAQAVVRSFDMGGGVAAHDAELAEASPLLAVLATDGDSTRDWLQAGQALQRVLLTGVRAGLQASYLNQLVQVSHLRPRLNALIGDAGLPQVLLRMGYTQDRLTPSPRRPVSDCVVSDEMA